MRSCILSIALLAVIVTAAPHRGDRFDLLQPDGSRVPVLVWGDEYYQRVTDLNDYTLVRSSDGWIYYATLSADNRSLVPTQHRYLGTNGSSVRGRLALAGISAGLDIEPQARTAKALTRRHAMSRASKSYNDESPWNKKKDLKGSILGLTVLVDFPNFKSTVPRSEFNDFLNKIGYNNYRNNGSVRQYFKEVSNNQLDYQNETVGFYTAKRNKEYYDDKNDSVAFHAVELLNEVLNWAQDSLKFDFTKISHYDTTKILALNFYYAGTPDAGWAKGLWPHSNVTDSAFFKTADGKHYVYQYQMTNIGADLSIGTFCHENCHMVCRLDDLYDYDYDSKGVGLYCIMSANDDKNPQPPCAPYRYLLGWDTLTKLIPSPQGITYQSISNSNASYVFENKNDKDEMFFIESRVQKGRSTVLPDEGLIVWHADWNRKRANKNWQQMKPDTHYIVSVEQADGRFDLEKNVGYGGPGDLFKKTFKNRFNDYTAPHSHWWNDSLSGLAISGITSAADTMYFTLGELPLSLMHPETGDSLYSGDTTKIIWQCHNDSIKQVKIELSLDNGKTFSVIKNAIDNSGLYTWIIPMVESNGCIMRIADVKGRAAYVSERFVIRHDPLIAIEASSLEATVKKGLSTDMRLTVQNTGKGVLKYSGDSYNQSNGLVINEMYVSKSTFIDGFELRNNGPEIDITGWRLIWNDNWGTSGTFTFPPCVMKAGRVAVMADAIVNGMGPDSIFYVGVNLNWSREDNNPPLMISVALVNSCGHAVDFVRTKGNTDPVPAGCVWNGEGVELSQNVVRRINNLDTDSKDDWAADSTPTFLTFNPNQNNNEPFKPFVALSQKYGELSGLTNKYMYIRLSATNLAAGVYRDTIVISHNSRKNGSPLLVPIKLTVEEKTTAITEKKENAGCLTFGPNPVNRNDGKAVTFALPPSVAHATITVFDCLGNTVRTLHYPSESSWNLKDKKGRLVGQGSYKLNALVTDKRGDVKSIQYMIGVKE
ncbi:MAG: M6 family metalloprotease domain-containing protein [Chitinivibrionales bacterium]|nr:M6 family metalloprotease domain-containing protein [Chitinivibrionales bacterium]